MPTFYFPEPVTMISEWQMEFCRYRHISFYCNPFYCDSQQLHFFFQIEGLKVCTPVSSKSIVLFLQHLLTFCHILVVVAVQLLSCVQFFATPWTAARQASLSFTISQSLLKLMSIESMMPSSHLILCCPLLFLPSIFPSIKVVSSELSLCIRRPKYWSFSFSISPSNDYS